MKRALILAVLSAMSSVASANMVTCRFEPMWQPIAVIRYDVLTGDLWTETGFPAVTNYYGAVEEVALTDGSHGVALTSSQGELIAEVRLTFAGRIVMEREMQYPFEAKWGDIQGPAPRTEGVCWSTALPPVNTDINR